MEAYLDNAATTKVSNAAARVALDVMTNQYGNPSSRHRMGREAKAVLDRSREQVSRALGAKPGQIFFTSGGTESNNWALLSAAERGKRQGRHIISSQAEHDSVLQTLALLERRGFEVAYLKPDRDGGIQPGNVEQYLREDTILLSLMLVNNETGAITDVPGISRLLRNRLPNALLHTDAVQGFLKLPFFAPALGADLITISGHKIHAPKGVGALYIRDGLVIPPMMLGGGQESGNRSGTEALPQIAAFGAAAEEGLSDMAEAIERASKFRDIIIERLRPVFPGMVQNCTEGAAHILSLSFPGYRSEVLMNYLESQDVFVSNSSACSRGRRSHVLTAMGLPAAVIDSAIRLSLSRFTTMDELERFCESMINAKENLVAAK